MERKKYNKGEVDRVLNSLFKKATNRSKAKSKDDVVGSTPEEDGCNKLSEWDICMNRTYSTYFIKCFYDGNTKAYRYDFKEDKLSNWQDLQLCDVTEDLIDLLDDSIDF